MKILHFTNNISDGAGRAAYRLHKALQGGEINSLMLVYKKTGEDDSVEQISDAHIENVANPIQSNTDILKRGLEFLPFICRQVYRKLLIHKWKPTTLFNFNIPYVAINKIKRYLFGVDIICLHSVQSFLSSSLLKDIYKICKAPIIWTLMDMEPLTGGCHFNNGCLGFTKSCGNCPQLALRREKDISRIIWLQKNRDLKDVPITLVAASNWVYDHITSSSLFGKRYVKKIFLSADHTVFKKREKEIARQALDLPKNSKIILFGCFNLSDKRKGAEYLKGSLKILATKITPQNKNLLSSVILVTFGRRHGFSFSDTPFEWIHLGELKDDRTIALSYQSADVLACPSVDDFGPLMVSEAFMCDLPVVAFKRGVALDLLKSTEAGYLAERYDIDDFSKGIFQCLAGNNDCSAIDEIQDLKLRCQVSFQAKEYHLLFKELLGERV